MGGHNGGVERRLLGWGVQEHKGLVLLRAKGWEGREPRRRLGNEHLYDTALETVGVSSEREKQEGPL